MAKLHFENYLSKLGIQHQARIPFCQLASVLHECKFTQKAKLLIKIRNNDEKK